MKRLFMFDPISRKEYFLSSRNIKDNFIIVSYLSATQNRNSFKENKNTFLPAKTTGYRYFEIWKRSENRRRRRHLSRGIQDSGQDLPT